MKFLKVDKDVKVEVNFSYEESCKNVYKHFTVHRNGKKSNITGLKKYLKDVNAIPEIVTAKTFYWYPSSNSSGRRNNERKNNNIVRQWLIKEGFMEVE